MTGREQMGPSGVLIMFVPSLCDGYRSMLGI